MRNNTFVSLQPHSWFVLLARVGQPLSSTHGLTVFGVGCAVPCGMIQMLTSHVANRGLRVAWLTGGTMPTLPYRMSWVPSTALARSKVSGIVVSTDPTRAINVHSTRPRLLCYVTSCHVSREDISPDHFGSIM